MDPARDVLCKKVLYVPKLAYNLVSVSRATEARKVVTFSKAGCEFSDDHGQVTAFATKQGSLYLLGNHSKVYMQQLGKKAKRGCGIDALGI